MLKSSNQGRKLELQELVTSIELLQHLSLEERAKLVAADGERYDFFGNAVAISGDTVVVGAWWDDDKGDRAELVILDARRISDGPVCVLPLPMVVPFGLHGTFAPEA